MSLTHEECLQKLENLKKWQEKQQTILQEKQKEQKRLLIDEQQKLYTDYSFINNNKGVKTSNEDEKLNNNGIAKKAFLKRGEGLQNRFGIHPDKFKLNNLPKYKYSEKKVKKNFENKKVERLIEDNQDETRQDFGIENITDCNGFSKEEIDYNLFKEKLEVEKHKNSNDVQDNDNLILIKPGEKCVTWRDILEPPKKTSLLAQTHLKLSQSINSQDKIADLEFFELLEKKVDNSSFCSNSSSIIQLLEKQHNPKRSVNATESPQIVYHPKQVVELSSENGSSIDDQYDRNINENSDDSSNSSVHVRFSDRVVVNEINSESDYDEDKTLEQLNTTNTSTPNDKIGQNYQLNEEQSQFQLNHNPDITILIQQLLDSKQREIEERNELLKIRLKDLESEISLYQNQNKLLTKMKQDCELEKIEMENYFRITKENLDDERIKIEIYLNDEKSKLNEEKQKFERKLNNPSKKEKEEIVRLREQILELQQDIKTKETKQVSAQSRLRAQIRNLEKNLREKELEIESIVKENKKLDAENIRLRRQNSNKMLKEINKNLVKLAPISLTMKNAKGSLPDLTKNKKSSPNRKSLRNMNSSTSEPSESDSSSDTDENIKPFLKSSYFKNLDTKVKTNIVPQGVIDQSESTEHIEEAKQTDVSETTKSLKREISNPDGSKDIWYPNGNIKKISQDGLMIKMLYYNKDIKETNIGEGTVRYYYSQTNTWHTSYLDGLEILEFPNGQTEHRFKNGKIEVHFSNGAIRVTNPNDPEIAEEWRYPDGTLVKIKINGERNILLQNGQKEIHTNDHKRREYPDGTVKIVYQDGSQETRYSNGRVRLKDKDGKLLMDSNDQFK